MGNRVRSRKSPGVSHASTLRPLGGSQKCTPLPCRPGIVVLAAVPSQHSPAWKGESQLERCQFFYPVCIFLYNIEVIFKFQFVSFCLLMCEFKSVFPVVKDVFVLISEFHFVFPCTWCFPLLLFLILCGLIQFLYFPCTPNIFPAADLDAKSLFFFSFFSPLPSSSLFPSPHEHSGETQKRVLRQMPLKTGHLISL